MNAANMAIVIITCVILLGILFAIGVIFNRRRRLQQEDFMKHLFIPQGQLPYMPLGYEQIKSLPQAQKEVSGQTLSGATCFVTGMPRSSCMCEDCVERRRSS